MKKCRLGVLLGFYVFITIFGSVVLATSAQAAVCATYNSKVVAEVRKDNVNIGNILINNNDTRAAKIRLYHSDAPGSIFATWHIANDKSTSLTMQNERINIGSDWGIQIVFGDGVTSCVYPIATVGSFENGKHIVKAKNILSGENDCPFYNSEITAALRPKISIGNILITSHIDSSVKLYHPDSKLLNTYASWSFNSGESSHLAMQNKRINIGGDWGIRVVDTDGVTSCIYPITTVGSFENGKYIVNTKNIVAGKVPMLTPESNPQVVGHGSLRVGNSGGYFISADATLKRDGKLATRGGVNNDSLFSSVKASFFVEGKDIKGRSLFVSNIFEIPTACSTLDKCSSHPSKNFSQIIGSSDIARYVTKLSVYIGDRSGLLLNSRNTISNKIMKEICDASCFTSNDLPTKTKMALCEKARRSSYASQIDTTLGQGGVSKTNYSIAPVPGFDLVASTNKLWTQGQTIRVRFVNGELKDQQRFFNVLNDWGDYANLKIVHIPSGNGDADIRIRLPGNNNKDNGSHSFIGTDSRTYSYDDNGIGSYDPKASTSNKPSINYGWESDGTILHEFGHALGFQHEHMSPKSDIIWKREVVYNDLCGYPNYWSINDISHNLFGFLDSKYTLASTFDPASIMIYNIKPQWTTNKTVGITRGDTLSDMDKSFAATIYPFPK